MQKIALAKRTRGDKRLLSAHQFVTNPQMLAGPSAPPHLRRKR